MITFLCAIAALLLGYITYGSFVERIFKPTDAPTPATFMSAVTFTYILQAKEGFQLGIDISYPAGIIFAIICAGLFLRKVYLEK